MGENGEIGTYPADVDGERVELPMVRAESDPPPCEVCPKIPAGLPKSWENADEFDEWFFDARQWFRECRAVADFGGPDPLMRAVAAEFADADRRARDDGAAAFFKALGAK